MVLGDKYFSSKPFFMKRVISPLLFLKVLVI